MIGQKNGEALLLSLDGVATPRFGFSKSDVFNAASSVMPQSGNRSHWINDRENFRDIGYGETGQSRVFTNQCLALGQIDAEGFVGGDV